MGVPNLYLPKRIRLLGLGLPARVESLSTSRFARSNSTTLPVFRENGESEQDRMHDTLLKDPVK